jgi:amino-acid N-acetyltransferase
MTAQFTIEAAHPDDLDLLLALLSENGLPAAGFEAHLSTALVARANEHLAGCAALEIYGRAALLRSVAVARGYRGLGLGQQLTRAALQLARAKGVSQVYLLTETAAGFFPKFGFNPVSRAEVLPAVKESVEFTLACPQSALVMALNLID